MTDCACSKCKACCWRSPGWFGSIEEIEGAAKIKGLSVEEFCQEYLIQEWWSGEDEDVTIPAPRKNFSRPQEDDKWWHTPNEEIQRNGKGFVKASWAHNLISGFACIFLTEDEMCSIHESKPTECREVFGCEIKEDSDYEHRPSLVGYWKDRQHLLPKEKDND